MVSYAANHRWLAFVRRSNVMIHPLLLDILFAVGALALISAFVIYQVYQFSWLSSHGRQISAMVTSIRHETGKTAW